MNITRQTRTPLIASLAMVTTAAAVLITNSGGASPDARVPLERSTSPVAVVERSGDSNLSRVLLRDGPGDVWRSRYHWGDQLTRTRNPAADVMRARAGHGTHNVVIRMRFLNLRRIGAQEYRVSVSTPILDLGDEPVFTLNTQPGERRGTLNSSPSCGDAHHRINYDLEVITLRVPRHCLGDPRWVRVNMDNQLWWYDDYGEVTVSYTDNPHNHRSASRAYTPRLYRN